MAFTAENLPSPNFTHASDAREVYGRGRTIDGIVIHWWGDPAQNPTYEGVVAHLRDPDVGVSAHYVATGTGRRVASLVNEDNIAWCSNSANPYTIAIECDPRCRDEDYDVVAELIMGVWKRRGKKPLYPHSKFAQTICPGNYDLGRLEALANKKLKGEDKTMEEKLIKSLFAALLRRDARTEDEWKYWIGRDPQLYIDQTMSSDEYRDMTRKIQNYPTLEKQLSEARKLLEDKGVVDPRGATLLKAIKDYVEA